MTKRRKIAGAVAGVAVLVVVGGAAWAARGGSAPVAVPAATEPSTAVVESACGLVGTVDPAAGGAQAARWEGIGGGWSLPVSETDGPGVRDPHGPWSCFAHTPSGAVLAATVIPGRIELADDRPAVIRAQTIPGAGQDALLKQSPDQLTELATVQGFTIAAYAPDRATVGLYMHTASLEALCTMNVVWSAGDWRVQLQDDGSSSSGCQPGVPASFTPWGP